MRRTSTPAAFLALLVLAALTGCHRGPGLVAVRGRLTLNGGAWPKSGVIFFSPAQAAEGLPQLVGMARFETDGSFSAMTGDAQGLMPGQYKIAIECWERSPSNEGKKEAGKCAMPEHYRFPATSGLELDVPPGSAPITFAAHVK